LYRGDSLWQFQIGLYCTLVRSPLPSLPLDPFPSPLQTIARGFFVLFHMGMLNPSIMFLYLNLLRSPSRKYPPTTPVLHCCVSLLISKSTFKGVSRCTPTVGVLYFGLFNPFHYSLLPLTSHPPFFNSFQYTSYILYLHRCYAFWYCGFSIILFSFPSSPEFYRVLPLSQTCSTMRFCMIMFVLVYMFSDNL
jgi:hypothetical protein